MLIAKKISLFCMLLALCACGKVENKVVIVPCPSKEACLTDPNCHCWCSQLCGFRKKTAEDNPIYVENDPYEKYCYCKQWDFDHYEDNCINHKNVQQPKGAK